MFAELNTPPADWIKQSQTWEGQLPPGFFERLPDELAAAESPIELGLLSVKTAQGYNGLLLGFSTRVTQTCQRCMTHVSSVLAQTRLIIVASSQSLCDELEAQLEDDEDAAHHSGVLVPRSWQKKGIPGNIENVEVMLNRDYEKLSTLIEDEIMMALPIVPLHDQCPDPDAYRYLTESDAQQKDVSDQVD